MGKKQADPGPLDESLITRKRKLAAPTNGAIKKQKVVEPMVVEKKASVKAPREKVQKDKKSRAGDKVAEEKQKVEKKKENVKPKKTKKEETTVQEDLDDLVSSEDDDDLDLEDDDLLDSDGEVMDSDEEMRGGAVGGGGKKKKMMWSDDEDSDGEEKLTAANIAGLSRKLDEEQAQEAADAEAELHDDAMQTNIANDLIDGDVDDDETPGAKELLAPDLQLLRTRITEVVRVLTSFKELAEPGRSRADYTTGLLKDICTYYGYSPFLAEKLFNLFPAQEALAFFDANETPRPMVIRTNTLRTGRRELAHALINRGVTLEPVGKWSKVGLQIFESQVPLGATPEYLAGHYILQAASSFLPVMALAPQEHERVLDMAAAPGGKTTHLAALMRNTGCIFSNDSNKDRAKGLIGNIHRLGVKNTIVCNYSALEFPRVMGGFDRVLLDAPCSGTGVIAKDASVKTNKTEADFLRLPHLQKQLLLAAVDSVDHASKTGGYIVYSTCSVTIEENEMVVQYVLNKRPNIKLVPTGLIFGKEGFTSFMGKTFHPAMKDTRRYYPHAFNVDGFFVAKFKKTGPTPAAAVLPQGSAEEKRQHKKAEAEADADEDVYIHQDIEEGDEDKEETAFAEFDDEEDEVLIERGLNKNLKRKGIDPKAKKAKGKTAAK